MHDLFAAGGSVQRLDSKPGHFPLHRGDVLAYSFQGGGGYGDPIRRDPARVARDVNNGLVTPHWASARYGVVMRDGAVDAEATRERRRAIRAERLGDRPPKSEPPEGDGMPPSARASRTTNAFAASAAPISVRRAKIGNRGPRAASCRRKPAGRTSRCTPNWSCGNLSAASAARCWNSKSPGAARHRWRRSSWTPRRPGISLA